MIVIMDLLVKFKNNYIGYLKEVTEKGQGNFGLK
jgi:hypothetical protein